MLRMGVRMRVRVEREGEIEGVDENKAEKHTELAAAFAVVTPLRFRVESDWKVPAAIE